MIGLRPSGDMASCRQRLRENVEVKLERDVMVQRPSLVSRDAGADGRKVVDPSMYFTHTVRDPYRAFRTNSSRASLLLWFPHRALPRLHLTEIGRASCRERVWSSVVAVS